MSHKYQIGDIIKYKAQDDTYHLLIENIYFDESYKSYFYCYRILEKNKIEENWTENVDVTYETSKVA